MATIFQVRDKIDLTEQERLLIDFLRRVVLHSALSGLDIDVGVASGWVRGKLLGRESNNIDIAIDSISGTESPIKEKTGIDFCGEVNKYLSSKGEERIDPVNIPMKSKHLETTKIRLFDFEIDVVNLRTKRYGESSESSRVPTDVPGARHTGR